MATPTGGPWNSDAFRVSETGSKQIEKASPTCAWPSSQKQEKSATVGSSPMSHADSPSHLSIVLSVAGLIGEGARPRSGRMAGAKEEMVISRVLRWCQLKYSCERPAEQSAESSGAEGAAQAGAAQGSSEDEQR